LLVRGERVLLDQGLAALYKVPTRSLVQATKRNASRFPADFMFQLTAQESRARGGRRSRPYAFTEHGVAMLASVLRSGQAIRVNIEIVRAFVRLRRMMSSCEDLSARLDELESACEVKFKSVCDFIRQLLAQRQKPLRRIGFGPNQPASVHDAARN
jgi:hypothetical protein